MATKRPHDGYLDCPAPDLLTSDGAPAKSIAAPSSKRLRKSNTASSKARQHQNAFIDSTFGQKYFFAGQGTPTSIPKDDELDFEDDSAAMAYLTSVRHQASGIPHLLVAPKIKIGPQLPAGLVGGDANDRSEAQYCPENNNDYEHGDHCHRDEEYGGYYEDGAYTAAPKAVLAEDQHVEIDPKQVLSDVYYSSILDRFHALRGVLHRPPPKHLVEALPKTHGHFVGTFGPRSSTFVLWNKRLLDFDPHPAQLASMEKDGVLRILRVIMGGKFLRRGHDVRERTARWIWALLARLPDAGQMQHTEIAWIRDLGRRAVLMTRSLVEMAALRDELASSTDFSADLDVDLNTDLGVHSPVGDSDANLNPLVEMEVNDSDEVLIHNATTEERSHSGRSDSHTSPGKDSTERLCPASSSSSTAVPQLSELDGESMDMSDEEGQVVEDSQERSVSLEAAKSRLLARISAIEHSDEMDYVKEPEILDHMAISPLADAEGVSIYEANRKDADDALAIEKEQRARINMRHTLNMILTVVGEIYGQRDLLEFRDPFPSI
ncbi:hypothetical protein CFIMG_003371RA [Ceratocystis fimbriata CBS 114723]|uniref:Uncharacterized protein n=1 Tax=Ceratocystis fimbriata CBS 114723 TaxID=1035309 RepID=A0A2C5XCQ3_9PEZI|nr:hypothetical protein CFIMG_003371RA [Ceratocystis fimbriata CBS 114723]